MNKQAQLRETIGQQPITQFAVARNGFAPSDQNFNGVLPHHSQKVSIAGYLCILEIPAIYPDALVALYRHGVVYG